MSFRHATLLLIPGLALAACSDSSTDPEPEPDPVEVMRTATESFQDVADAEAAGFVPLSACVASPAGGMGYHYGHPGRLEDAEVDLELPEVLLYVPTAAGLRLAGVEFMVHGDAWYAAGNSEAPSLAGQSFDPPNPEHPDEAIRPFYTLHAWVWEDNPSGMFAPFNPNVSCEGEGGAHDAHHHG